VTQAEGEWQIKANVDLSTVKLGLPDSIHGLVLSQLDRLPENHKLTLKVSSVLGYYIDLILVTEVHPEEKGVDEIEAEAAYMEAEEVVHQEMPERKIYAFRHQTTQEVAYQTLLHSQRQQLHQAVSEALAAQQPDAITQIAHHAYLGEVWPLALRYNLRAGEQAKRLQVMQQSIDFYQKALECAQALPDNETADPRKQIHLALGELLINTEQYDAADTHLAAALALAQAQGDWEAEARCCRWYGRSHELRGEYSPALEWLDKGFVALNGRTSLEEAELLGNAALINIRQGNFDQAVTHSQRGLAVGEALGDTAVQARAYRNLGIVDRRRGNSQSALEDFQKSLDLCVHLEDIYGQAMSHNLVANAYFMRGEWSSADFHYRRSLEMFTQIGNAYNQILVNNNLGGIALKQGRLDAALAYYQRALRLLEQIGGSLWVFGALYMNLGHVYVALEELDLAGSNLHLARDYFERAQLRDLLPELFGLFAEVAWHQTDLDAAANYAQQSLDLARELSMPREEGHNLRIMGEIVRTQGALAEAQQYFEDSYRLLHESDDEYEAAKTLFSLAQLYTTQNQIADAATALNQCEEIFGRLDASLDMDKIQQLRQEL
jgi:tetratricopeptide (TPR) repeat protein